MKQCQGGLAPHQSMPLPPEKNVYQESDPSRQTNVKCKKNQSVPPPPEKRYIKLDPRSKQTNVPVEDGGHEEGVEAKEDKCKPEEEETKCKQPAEKGKIKKFSRIKDQGLWFMD